MDRTNSFLMSVLVLTLGMGIMALFVLRAMLAVSGF